MGKSKKHRKEESSETEDSTESSSSSSSSSEASNQSSNCHEDKKHKSRKMKKIKTTKAKTQKRKCSSSSSSSSSSDSDNNQNESSSSSSNERKTSKKQQARESENDKKHQSKNKKIRTAGDELRSEEKTNRIENTENIKKEPSSLHNRSKWDSPSNDVDENKRERPKEKNWNKQQSDNSNYKRSRRHNDNKSERFSNRRNDYRERTDHDNEKRMDRGGEYEQSRNRDKKYRSRDNNYNDRRNNSWDNRNRKENRESRNQRDDRENRSHKDDRGNRNQRDDRENRRSRSPQRPKKFSRKRSDTDDKTYEWGKKEEEDKDTKPPEEREKPNFALSGKLTEEANKVNGIVIKYAEPPEARKPKRRWRLYPFKGEKALPTLFIHRQSCYLIGRDRKVCDLPVDHPSCSKQHASLQYRLVPFEREDGSLGKRVRPYLIDLESANGTFINNKRVESKKYIELLEKDVIKFGFSSREYVLLHENSKEDQLDDDITEEVQVKTEPTDD